jgi:hypothetical protein
MTDLLKLAYTIDYTQTRRRKKYVTHERKIKVISGEIIPGKKVYTEDYNENGDSIIAIKTVEYHTPFMIRSADETKDTYRVNTELLESKGIYSYQAVVEIIDVINYYSKDGKEIVDRAINSELVMGW